MTRSPGFTPAASSARCSAAVPLTTAIACSPARQLRTGSFELADLGTRRGDPVLLDAPNEQLLLATAKIGHRKGNAGPSSPAQSPALNGYRTAGDFGPHNAPDFRS